MIKKICSSGCRMMSALFLAVPVISLVLLEDYKVNILVRLMRVFKSIAGI